MEHHPGLHGLGLRQCGANVDPGLMPLPYEGGVHEIFVDRFDVRLLLTAPVPEAAHDSSDTATGAYALLRDGLPGLAQLGALETARWLSLTDGTDVLLSGSADSLQEDQRGGGSVEDGNDDEDDQTAARQRRQQGGASRKRKAGDDCGAAVGFDYSSILAGSSTVGMGSSTVQQSDRVDSRAHGSHGQGQGQDAQPDPPQLAAYILLMHSTARFVASLGTAQQSSQVLFLALLIKCPLSLSASSVFALD